MAGFFRGVIEGFYGRQWSWQQRQDYAGFLSRYSFDAYIYAPKGDAALRTAWRDGWSEETRQELRALIAAYHQQGLRFGVGFSPTGLFAGLSAADKSLLRQRVHEFNDLDVDILCILFDDMPVERGDLADQQVAIIEEICSLSSAGQHIFCPSYYSFDPVLEQLFGKMPDNYWRQLGEQLPDDIDCFWTGNAVISAQYQQQDIERIADQLRRRPVIWDNCPVNDGRLTSNFLPLAAYTGRPWQLAEWSSGHVVNPMNQAWLSQLVLSTLDSLYRLGDSYCPEQALQQSFQALLSSALAERLFADIELFREQGLSELSEQRRQQLLLDYSVFSEPVAAELCAWLQGEYRFDPACLTG